MTQNERVIQAQQQAPGADDQSKRRSLTRAQWIDVGLIALLIFISLLGLQAVFGSWKLLLAILGGLLVGGFAVWFGYTLRLNVLNTVLIAIVGYFVFGTLFALTGKGLLAVLPSFATLLDLALGAVFSWRDIVTLAAPVEYPSYIMVLPYISSILGMLISGLLMLRWVGHHPRSAWRRAVALIPVVVLYLMSVLVGTHDPFWGIARAVVFAAVALIWLGWRQRPSTREASPDASVRQGLMRRKLAGTAIVVGSAVALTSAIGFVSQPAIDDNRLVVRDEITPPFDPFPYESPLAGFREYTKLLNETTLFTINGMEQGDRLKLAVLDQYTGKKWQSASPSLNLPDAGTYSLVGRDLPNAPFITSHGSRSIELYVNGYSDIWMPTVGNPTSLSTDGSPLHDRRGELRYNEATGTGVVVGGLRQGDSYRFETEIQDAPLEGQLDNVPVADMNMPPAESAPADLVEAMQRFTAGETTPYGQLSAIEESLRSQGYLSHGLANDQAPSRAGHGLDRMQELFQLTYMIGDQEQYASAMALMARELGYPSRVVVGFQPKNEGGTVEVTGDDVTAWVEVAFEGFGWVAFDPTPEQTDAPVNTETVPQTKPRAQVRQPPQTDARPDDLVTAADRPNDEPPQDPGQFPVWVIILIASILGPLLLFLLVMLGFYIAHRIRRRRRNQGRPDERIAGAWEETVDRMFELGYSVPERETRPVMARALHPELAPVALAADRAVFSDAEPSEAEIEAVWADAERITKQAARDTTGWRRFTSRFRFTSGKRRHRRERNVRITADRAELRNRALRSQGADVPPISEIARIEADSPAERARLEQQLRQAERSGSPANVAHPDANGPVGAQHPPMGPHPNGGYPGAPGIHTGHPQGGYPGGQLHPGHPAPGEAPTHQAPPPNSVDGNRA